MPQQINIRKKLEFGRTTQRALTSAPDVNFAEFRLQTTATSGTCRGIYNRLYMSGAGADGESLRSYTDVVGVALTDAHGAHITLGFSGSTPGSVTGLGAAVRAQLGIPDHAMAADGTYTACQPEIYSSGSSSAVSAVTELSFIRCCNGGNATGVGAVDDKAYLIVLDGGAISSGNIVEASNTEANYAYSIRCKLAGTVMYLMAASAVG